FGDPTTLTLLLEPLAGAKLASDGKPPRHLRKDFDPEERQKRQIHEIDRHSQQLLEESPYVRHEFLKKLADLSNLAGNKPVPLEQYQKTVEEYRQVFRDEIIGRFD